MVFAEDSVQNKTATTSQHLDELPYFAEKYPGKVCCLCNLCERSALGQGDMLRIIINVDTLKMYMMAQMKVLKDQSEDSETVDAFGRKKVGPSKAKITINNELINELDSVGHDELPSLDTLISDGSYLYVHSMCAMWSLQIKRIDEDFVPKFEEMFAASLHRRCFFCTRRGATINCRMNCQKNFHLPCAAASGCFLIIESFQTFCAEHVNQVPYIAVDTNIECRHCFNLGDISKLLMCSTCGAHYHTNCVGLANFPDSRSGWNCQQCCKCLICRQSENGENRSIKCEQCQKVYHTTCLRPIMSSVPKYGWKCNRCRICSDCGARTPGAGASSRWHCHYTICDSCYQQRNKGFSCPICHKAYRAASHKEMVKCGNCNRFVHSGCDDEADLNVYHLKKETNPDYDYVCPPCKSGKQYGLVTLESTSVLNDQFPRDLESEFYDKDATEFTNMVDPLKISKKRIGFKELGRGGKVSKLFVGKGGVLSQINRKRSARGKNRQLLMLSSSAQTSTSSDINNSQCSEEDMSLEKKIVLCSSKDKFILMQDICVMCGSLGTDQDACLISCVQCGQCYHPHCANVTLSKTMLEKGWRCLDCTVCEGCGQKNDEARLILCDECDISYHIYCMSPPLDAVPNGNWKCKLCALCHKCGRNSPGRNSQWFNGFLECGPCASQSNCSVCSLSYNDNELIIQCNSCERWLHCLCDNIKNEDEAKVFNEVEYHCKACRKDKHQSVTPVPKLSLADSANKIQQVNSQLSNASNQEAPVGPSSSSAAVTNENLEATDNTFWIDGVCMSEQGFNMIRSLTTEIKKKRKMKSDCNQKDAAISSAIDSVVAGNSTPTPGEMLVDGSTAVVDKLPNTTYKDGMVWPGEDGSQPEGFSISINEEGISILRKKRQRNLQKLGIGGFNVRMRGIRKENEEIYMGTLENPSLTEEKKKKIIKKKLKPKLCESYPSYLQEAFFGKSLLDNRESISFHESDSSDDCYTSKIDGIPNPSSILKQKHTTKMENIPVAAAETIKAENMVALEADQNDSSQNMQMGALLFSNNSHVEDKLVKAVIKSENNIASSNIIAKPNIGMNSIKMEMGQYHANLVHNNVNVQSSGNHVTPQGFMQTNVSASNPCQQLHTQQQKLIQYSNHDQQMSVKTKQVSQYLTQKSEDPMLSQVKFERDVMLSDAVPTNERLGGESTETPTVMEETVKEPTVPGTQKTAEKMRKDEDLGDMATISAVLYANTQHPELKQLYPNWNERCKQILKKWRSLSTEMKAPFLQHAKDNRSVLRLRRSQQEPEKTYFHQKSLKEQEQERVWKQHQAKNKETYSTNKFSKNAFVGEFVRSEAVSTVNQKHKQPLFEMNFLPESSQCRQQTPILQTSDHVNSDQLTDSDKSHSQLDQQQPSFMTALSQQIPTQPHPSPMDDLSKVFDHNKSESTLQLSERNDIFLTDKNWSGVPKLPNSRDSLSSGAEKLEADENAGLGDILGGFGEGDDDDILKSLTAEICDDFNILEYADPELDEINGSQNLLSKLDFDENQKAL